MNRFLHATSFLVLGALGALGNHAIAADPGDDAAGDDCGNCLSGLMNWNMVFNVNTSSGNPCTVIATWWRRDGFCVLNDANACLPADPCKYICHTQNTCPGDAHEFLAFVNSNGALNFSMGVGNWMIVGAPKCDWKLDFTMCIVNLYTGEVQCQDNGASCGPCPAGVIIED